jgi:hypothetical protein
MTGAPRDGRDTRDVPDARDDGLPRWVPRPTLGLLLAATLALLAVGWDLKARCVGLPSVRIPKLACYTDIGGLYTLRGFDHDAVPYLQEFSEYPPLTGALQYAAALLSASLQQFFAVNALFLGLLAVATTGLLWLARPGDRRLWLWAGAPTLALYAFHNWDLLVVALAVAGLVAFGRGRPVAAGLLLGLGASAKWYPALFLPVLFLELLRRGARRDAWGLAGAGAAALAVCNLPPLLANPRLFLAAYTFHASRPANPETVWWVAAELLRRAGHAVAADWVLGTLAGRVLAFGFLAAAAATLWAAWKGRLPWLRACFAMLLAFLLLSKVFSVQYLLWVAPFWVLLDLPLPLVAGLWVADLAVYVTVIGYLAELSHGAEVGGGLEVAVLVKMSVAVLLRAALLAAALAWAWRRPEPEGPESSGARGRSPQARA